MKKQTLTLLMAAGMATCAFGQSLILDNLSNGGALGAASGGRVFVDGVLFDGNTFNLGVVVQGGPSAGSLSPMGTFTAATDPKTYTGADVGKFQLGAAFAAVAVPGVAAGGTATIRLDVWYDGAGGLFANYAAAVASAAGRTASVTFQNGVSNPGGAPPVPAPNLTGMPSINLVGTVPEPSTIALGAIGLASMLIFRRRN